MPSREIYVKLCENQNDIERAYHFVDGLRHSDDLAIKSPTVKRYHGLLSSITDVRRAHRQDRFCPSLILEKSQDIILGVGSVALQRTIFHPAEGEMISSEIDYVTGLDMADDEHIQLADHFFRQQQHMNSLLQNSRSRRRYPSFASLVADNPYQARGVALSGMFYAVDGSGHLHVDPDASNIGKSGAILALHHSR